MIAPPDIPIPRSTEADSDSDWDEDDDFGIKKINIKIKPIAQVTPSKISASVDELRATVETWKSMASINLVKPNSRRHHHMSTAQLDNIDRALDINNRSSVFEPSVSSSTLLPDISKALLNPNASNGSTLASYGFPKSLSQSTNTQNNISLSSSTYGILPTSKGNQFLDYLSPDKPAEHQPELLPAVDLVQTLSHKITPPILKSPPLNHFAVADRPEFVATKIPLAFAIQESISARLVARPIDQEPSILSMVLSGRLKMAVPRSFINLVSSIRPESIKLELMSSLKLEKVNCNQNLCHELYDDSDQRNKPNSLNSRKIQINLDNVLEEVRSQQNQRASGPNYFLLPDLIRYTTSLEESQDPLKETKFISPLIMYQNLICSENAIKFRLDLKINPALELEPRQVTNIKIVLPINGRVLSFESKPAAAWDSFGSKLIWSFKSLDDLIKQSQEPTSQGLCLARFTLDKKQPCFESLKIHFTLPGRTISGVRVLLTKLDHYHICKQKLETRSSNFECEIPENNPLI